MSEKLNPSHLPPQPLSQWDDETLVRKWVDYWRSYQAFGGGVLRLLSIHAIHSELVNRGINPAEPLQEAGYNVESVHY